MTEWNKYEISNREEGRQCNKETKAKDQTKQVPNSRVEK